MNVYENIKEIRQGKGITQEVLADALHVDTSVISNIEKGKRELRVNELEKIAKCLDTDVVFLITYPKRYVEEGSVSRNSDVPEKISLSFDVTRERAEVLMKLLFGM